MKFLACCEAFEQTYSSCLGGKTLDLCGINLIQVRTFTQKNSQLLMINKSSKRVTEATLSMSNRHAVRAQQGFFEAYLAQRCHTIENDEAKTRKTSRLLLRSQHQFVRSRLMLYWTQRRPAFFPF